jgi:hypothetical protein
VGQPKGHVNCQAIPLKSHLAHSRANWHEVEKSMKKSHPKVNEILKAKEDRRRKSANLPATEKSASESQMRDFVTQLRGARKPAQGKNRASGMRRTPR